MEDRVTRLEERLAHLMRAADELSDQVRSQWDRIAALEQRVAFLSAREAERLRAEAQDAEEPGEGWRTRQDSNL